MHHETREFSLRIKPVYTKLLLGAVVVLDCLDCRFLRSLLDHNGYFRTPAGGHMPVALPDANASTSWVVRSGKRDLTSTRQNAVQIVCTAPEITELQETT